MGGNAEGQDAARLRVTDVYIAQNRKLFVGNDADKELFVFRVVHVVHRFSDENAGPRQTRRFPGGFRAPFCKSRAAYTPRRTPSAEFSRASRPSQGTGRSSGRPRACPHTASRRTSHTSSRCSRPGSRRRTAPGLAAARSRCSCAREARCRALPGKSPCGWYTKVHSGAPPGWFRFLKTLQNTASYRAAFPVQVRTRRAEMPAHRRSEGPPCGA